MDYKDKVAYKKTCQMDLQYYECPPLSYQYCIGFARALKRSLCSSWLLASDLWSINEASTVFKF